MSATDAPPQLASDYAVDTAGNRLRSAREHLNLTLREVASDLNLMVSHVRGMESNRCSHLTNDNNFLRHIRSYATLVAIDADELVELYQSQSAASEAAVLTLPTKRFKALNRYDSKWYAVGVLALACVSLGIWSLNQASQVTATSSAVPSGTATSNKATSSTGKSINKTAQKNPASAPEPASNDLIEVAAGNKSEADVAISTINTVSKTPAITSNENDKTKPTKRASAPPAAKTLARSDQTMLATARKSSRNSSRNNAQYKNALRSLGAKPLRKTLIVLKIDGAEQDKS